ncbi:hypothetical protein DV096_03950 [Bradymonadaceae bacterium TMQ3]|nr:hypothetical protein DV096_03950 [Bradymonadaceae bacterium TMQ3]TXC77527.1 hypothetical protein FRC91_01985 [Bradymonadales bacterium TMQ1]
MTSTRSWIYVCAALCAGLVTPIVSAEELVEESINEEFGEALVEEEPAAAEVGGFHVQSSLAIRPFPIGLALRTQGGFKKGLFESDSPLLSGTYIDGGISTSLSPAAFWAGPYLELLPVAVLKLKVSANFMTYFGTWGYLYVPGDAAQDWSLDALSASADQGLGQSTTGMMVEAEATPQMKVGRVVFQAPTTFGWMKMDVANNYYEPIYDLFFAPEDTYWVTRPTLGYLFGENPAESFVLLGARWEHTSIANSGVVRDTVGLLFNWKLPSSYLSWGDASISGFGGMHIDHPNRGELSPYLGIQAGVKLF